MPESGSGGRRGRTRPSGRWGGAPSPRVSPQLPARFAGSAAGERQRCAASGRGTVLEDRGPKPLCRLPSLLPVDVNRHRCRTGNEFWSPWLMPRNEPQLAVVTPNGPPQGVVFPLRLWAASVMRLDRSLLSCCAQQEGEPWLRQRPPKNTRVFLVVRSPLRTGHRCGVSARALQSAVCQWVQGGVILPRA